MSAPPPRAEATLSAGKRLRRALQRLAAFATWSSVLVTPLATPADAYDPIWYSMDGGSMGSSGGTYRLSGTIGQPDAGTLSGGGFTLRGGFWRGGTTSTVDVPPSGARPLSFQFRAPVPNPARSQSRLSFDLPTSAEVRLRVHDLSGRAVRTMALGRLAAGPHDRVWNTTDDADRPLPAGVYFMRLEAGAHHALRRVLVLR